MISGAETLKKII